MYVFDRQMCSYFAFVLTYNCHPMQKRAHLKVSYILAYASHSCYFIDLLIGMKHILRFIPSILTTPLINGVAVNGFS